MKLKNILAAAIIFFSLFNVQVFSQTMNVETISVSPNFRTARLGSDGKGFVVNNKTGAEIKMGFNLYLGRKDTVTVLTLPTGRTIFEDWVIDSLWISGSGSGNVTIEIIYGDSKIHQMGFENKIPANSVYLSSGYGQNYGKYFTDLQTAVNAANYGDVVIVGPGTYDLTNASNGLPNLQTVGCLMKSGVNISCIGKVIFTTSSAWTFAWWDTTKAKITGSPIIINTNTTAGATNAGAVWVNQIDTIPGATASGITVNVESDSIFALSGYAVYMKSVGANVSGYSPTWRVKANKIGSWDSHTVFLSLNQENVSIEAASIKKYNAATYSFSAVYVTVNGYALTPPTINITGNEIKAKSHACYLRNSVGLVNLNIGEIGVDSTIGTALFKDNNGTFVNPNGGDVIANINKIYNRAAFNPTVAMWGGGLMLTVKDSIVNRSSNGYSALEVVQTDPTLYKRMEFRVGVYGNTSSSGSNPTITCYAKAYFYGGQVVNSGGLGGGCMDIMGDPVFMGMRFYGNRTQGVIAMGDTTRYPIFKDVTVVNNTGGPCIYSYTANRPYIKIEGSFSANSALSDSTISAGVKRKYGSVTVIPTLTYN